MVKTEKGVTLIALIVYVAVFMIVIAIMGNISNYFYKNVAEIKEPLKYPSEFNKFNMFFINDVKKNKTAVSNENGTSIKFEDGTTYIYSAGKIYRDDIEIAKNVKDARFYMVDSYYVGNVEKEIVNVQIWFLNDPRSEEEITEGIDYVLKYW